MVIFGRNRLRLRQRAPFPLDEVSTAVCALSAQVLKNAGRLRCQPEISPCMCASLSLERLLT